MDLKKTLAANQLAEQAMLTSKKEIESAQAALAADLRTKQAAAKLTESEKELADAKTDFEKASKEAEKFHKEAVSATSTYKREVARWKAHGAEEARGLAEKQVKLAFTNMVAQRDKHRSAETDKAAAEAELASTRANVSEDRAHKIGAAEELEKQAERENCHMSPTQLNMIHRWEFNGDLSDSIGHIKAFAVGLNGGAIPFENGAYFLRLCAFGYACICVSMRSMH